MSGRWLVHQGRRDNRTSNEDRSKALAALAIYYVDENPYMQLPAPFTYAAWWPWVNNYFGETDTGFVDTSHIISRLWIDEDQQLSNWTTGLIRWHTVGAGL